MVDYISSWLGPAPAAAGAAAPSGSSFSDTILAVALSALALITANAFDRTNPGLALVLRCTAGGIGLIWLFSRCCPPSSGGGSTHVGSPPPPRHPAPAPALTRRTHSDYWGWAWPIWPPDERSSGPAPVAEFPTAHRAPARPDPTPMYEVPKTRGGSTTTYPDTSHTRTTTTHTYTKPKPTPAPAPMSTYSDPYPPKTARTTYSYADPAPRGFPTASTQSSTSTTRTHTYTQPAPAPTSHHTYTASSASGAFPTVQLASAQPDSTPMYAVPKTR